MRDTFVVAVGCTPFGKHPDKSISELSSRALTAALGDLGDDYSSQVGSVWFGSAFMDAWGQANIRGQAALAPLIAEGLLPARVPITNVEGACATGSFALRGAVLDVRAGEADLAVAVGVEKMHLPDAPGGGPDIFTALAGCAEHLQEGRLERTYAEVASIAGRRWQVRPEQSLFLETYAVQAQLHMKTHGVTVQDIAIGCSKTHAYAAQNPLAQYRFPLTVEEVLADRAITEPFTRAMCAPLSDGAAVAIVGSAEWLANQPRHIQDRAVRVRGIGVASGQYERDPYAPTLTRTAARRAYESAGLAPQDVDVVEVHDATSYAEIYQLEMLELCAPGEGAKLVSAGETGPGGSLPVNTSGGLVAKGHPVGATGLSMTYELVQQLRQEAGSRQVEGARIGLAENGGGVLGLEEATCVVTVLEAQG